MIDSGKAAIFLDRDKTLIEDPGYLGDPEQVRLLPGVPAALSRLREAGFPTVVVTNQSGIARGYFTEGELAAVHHRMRELLRAEGADVDAIYYCPFLAGPEAVRERYRRDSELRKPRPGMLLLAAKEMEIDLSASWMIGDSRSDIEAGRDAGCRTILLGNGRIESVTPDFVAPDLPAAVERILSEAAARRREVVPPAVDVPPPAGGAAPGDSAADIARLDATLHQILEELRVTKREQRYADFSVGQLVGAIAQAFALCAVGWGIYAAIDGAQGNAVVRLLVGVALQLMALTGFLAGKRK